MPVDISKFHSLNTLRYVLLLSFVHAGTDRLGKEDTLTTYVIDPSQGSEIRDTVDATVRSSSIVWNEQKR